MGLVYVIAAIFLIVINVPVYRFLFGIFFAGEDDFKESVKYSLTPDLFSLFRGRFFKDQFGEAKLSFFLFSCAAILFVEFFLLMKFIDLFR